MGHIPMAVDRSIAEQLRSPFWPPELFERYDLIGQGLSAELIAEKWADLARGER